MSSNPQRMSGTNVLSTSIFTTAAPLLRARSNRPRNNRAITQLPTEASKTSPTKSPASHQSASDQIPCMVPMN